MVQLSFFGVRDSAHRQFGQFDRRDRRVGVRIVHLHSCRIYLFIYAIGQIAVILICTFCFYIIAKFIPLTQYLLESFHAIVNNLALYLTAPLYIAVQSILIKDLAKGKDNEQNQQIS